MASVIQIVNRALDKLGQAHIASLDDKVEAAQLAAGMFEWVRDDLLSRYEWGFALGLALLASDVEKPLFDWAHKYAIPSDCLRVLRVGDWPLPVMTEYVGQDTSQYRILGNDLYTNIGPSLKCYYARRVENTALFPPSFAEAMACKLAIEMSEKLTASSTKLEIVAAQFREALKGALAVNAIQRAPVAVQDDSWVMAHQLGEVF